MLSQIQIPTEIYHLAKLMNYHHSSSKSIGQNKIIPYVIRPYWIPVLFQREPDIFVALRPSNADRYTAIWSSRPLNICDCKLKQHYFKTVFG